MLKILMLIFIVLILSINTVFSETVLTGGVNYTVAQTREIAFQNIPNKISIKTFEKFLKHKKRLSFRYAKTTFSNNTFAIIDKITEQVYYYTQNGDLYLVQLKNVQGKFVKHIGYNVNGKLDSITIELSPYEQFVFDANKKLIAHWIGKNGYDENGELFGTRD